MLPCDFPTQDETAMITEPQAEPDSSVKENVSTQEESPAKEPSPDAPVSGSSKDEAQAGLGENNNEEITIDDLPSKLTVLSQV